MTLFASFGTARRLLFALSFVTGCIGLAPETAPAQNLGDMRVPAITLPDVALPRVTLPTAPNLGAGLVFYGNYCGPGSRGRGRRPVDALDAACARHDACTPPPGTLPSCGCNARLQRDAMTVAMTRRTPEDTRAAARFVAEGIKLAACR